MIHQKQAGGTFIGLFIGLVLGVVIAAGVVWYMNKTPIPFQNKEQRPHAEGVAKAAVPAPAPAQVETLPGKPGDAAPEKPRFEFYKILPGSEEAQPKETAPAAPPEAPKKADTLFLQAGAFQNAAEADNLKARLALMGIEASVEKVTTPEKGTLHRVRIGPYATPDEMTRVRTQLAQNGIEAGVVRNR